MLNLGVYAPIIGAIFLAAFYPVSNGGTAKGIGILSSAVSLAAVVFLWIGFGWWQKDALLGFEFAQRFELMGVSLPLFALNGISLPMYSLAGIVGFAATLWAVRSEIEGVKLYMILLLVMQGGLMGAFASTNVLWMYAFHEFALIPTFVAMLLWGGAGRKNAAIEMAIYLTLGALVSLLGIVALYLLCGNTFEIVEMRVAAAMGAIPQGWQKAVFGLLLFGLGTLVSLFPFYSWAPRAYSAAPTSFAMLHAGVLKKFGLYVLIQVALPLLPSGAKDWAFVLACLALFNVIYIGLVTMAQKDLKLMVSYSSVSHMGMCFLGVAALEVLGAGSALMLMFGHGLSVALLFMLSNAVVNRTGQWEMAKMGGLYKKTPILAAFFLAGAFASAGLPCFANFWGELGIFVALWKFSPYVCALAALGIIISAIYALRAFASVFMGSSSKEIESIEESEGSISDLSIAERLPAAVLLAALVFVGFFPMALTDFMNADLNSFAVLIQPK